MKIGILLPSAFDLGLLRRARHLSSMIAQLTGTDGSKSSVAIGLPAPSEAEWRRLESELRNGNSNVIVRHLQWEPVPVENARRMFANLPASLDLDGIDEVVVPRDWGWNFQDCDALIIFADPGLGAVLSLRPTAFYCTDLAVRIAPDAWAGSIRDDYWRRQTEAFRMWRQAHVWTSDPHTVDDIVSYAGVSRKRAVLGPNLLDQEAGFAPIHSRDSTFLAWLSGHASLHDFANGAKGLQIYLSEGGSLRPVLVKDELAASSADAPDIYEHLPTDLADFLYGLPTKSIGSERELARCLGQAGALWSSRIAGGEGEAPLLAAQAGLPFLGADFAINRQYAADAGLTANLYKLGDPLAIADGLHELERLVAKPRGRASQTTKNTAAKAESIQVMLGQLIEAGYAA